MGTHLYFQIEVTSTKNFPRLRWGNFARVYLPQDYLLFALLAAVRRSEFVDEELPWRAPKGLPADVDEHTLEEDSLVVDDEADKLDVPLTCSRAAAEEWVREGISRYLEDGYKVTHPDFHSHSWATREELEQIERDYKAAGGSDTSLAPIIAMMNAFDTTGHIARAVFWFE
jgi:hypothetical protein